MLLFVAGVSSLSMTSCKDNDGVSSDLDRQFMTMFITDNTRGKGSDYPYNCDIDSRYPHGNTIHLYWYGVNDCAGYQIQMSTPIKVANGADAWKKIQGTSDLLIDTIVGPNVLDLVIKDLQYKTDYRFAIRALSKLDENIKGNEATFAHASNWYGHGNGRQWQEYLNIQTKERYATPTAIYVNQAETTEETITVYLNSNIIDMVKAFAEAAGLTYTETDFDNAKAALADCTKLAAAKTSTEKAKVITDMFPTLPDEDKDNILEYFVNFNIEDNGDFGFKRLQVSPSPNNPTSGVGAKFKDYYEITDADRSAGKIVIDGLTANSVYIIDVVDPRVNVTIDSKYNTCTTRSDGTPGEPIVLYHDEMMAKYNNEVLPNNANNIKRSEVFELAAEYNAAPISNVLYDFISDTKYAEGQEFQLEGGKTYYIDGNDITCKGFVLRTRPEDVAKGLRAKVISAIGKNSTVYSGTNGEQWQGSTTMFMFGRQPEVGEGGEIYMKKLAFYDIDFDNPKAFNYTDNKAGAGTITGNYFFNMYSNGMAVTLDSLVISNCSFKRLVRGFIREQGPNYKVWNHVLIENNMFMDCGPYNSGGTGYPWIAAACNNPNTNLYKDFRFVGNTIYDCPVSTFFGEAAQLSEWKAGPWKITFSNNTLINFNTRGAGYIFKQSYMPDGSVYTVENNLFAIVKQQGDARTLGCWGANMSETSQPLADGNYGKVTLNFHDNYSTNDNLTNGQIFSSNPFTSGFKNLIDNNCATLVGDLSVTALEQSATDIFNQPLPPTKASTADDRNMHRADALDGSASQFNVDLRMKNTITIGAPRWWYNGQGTSGAPSPLLGKRR